MDFISAFFLIAFRSVLAIMPIIISVISCESLISWPYFSSGRNLKLPSRRPSLVCENCLYSLEQDARVRAFHIMDPKGVLDMFIVFLEERGSGGVPHPSFDNSKVF